MTRLAPSLARGVHPARVTPTGTAAELRAWFLIHTVALKLAHFTESSWVTTSEWKVTRVHVVGILYIVSEAPRPFVYQSQFIQALVLWISTDSPRNLFVRKIRCLQPIKLDKDRAVPWHALFAGFCSVSVSKVTVCKLGVSVH